MKTMVLRVIAEPPRIFGVPMLPAAGNLMLNVTLMIVGTMLFTLNPIPFFVSLTFGHAFLLVAALRDPHIATLATSWMETRRRTRNLVPAQGNKYVA